MDEATFQKYQGNAALEAAVMEEEGVGRVMRRDPETSYCTQLDGGWCKIHRDYGETYLGDACSLYPRIIRRLDDGYHVATALSCPESVRLALFTDKPFETVNRESGRVPSHVRDYGALLENISGPQAKAASDALIDALDVSSEPAERLLFQLRALASSLDNLAPESWIEAVPVLWKLCGARIATPEPFFADNYRLLHSLAVLVYASRKKASSRLMTLMDSMQAALDARIDWEKLEIQNQHDDFQAVANRLSQQWQQQSASLQPVLKRWLQLQIIETMFPASGPGTTAVERVTVIGVRYALLKLALTALALQKGALLEEDIIQCIQAPARVMNHLAEMTLSLELYRQCGWMEEARLNGLIAG